MLEAVQGIDKLTYTYPHTLYGTVSPDVVVGLMRCAAQRGSVTG